VAKLSKRVVEASEARSRDYVIWDDELPGFGLRVFVSGKRSYLIQYRAAGRSRRYTIGFHGVWTPELARKEAKIQLGRVARGDNPAEERQLDHRAVTVKELCELYLRDLEAGLVLGKGGRPKKATTIVTDTGRRPTAIFDRVTVATYRSTVPCAAAASTRRRQPASTSPSRSRNSASGMSFEATSPNSESRAHKPSWRSSDSSRGGRLRYGPSGGLGLHSLES